MAALWKGRNFLAFFLFSENLLLFLNFRVYCWCSLISIVVFAFAVIVKEVMNMATKSILKNIHIRDKRSAWNLVNALENAKKKKGKEVILSKNLNEIKGEKIKEFFGG